MNQPLAITGMGVCCAGGGDCSAFFETLRQGLRRFSFIEDERLAHCTCRYAGLVHDTIEQAGDGREDRYVSLARIALKQACAQAGLAGARCGDMGLFLGTCSGPMPAIEEYYRKRLAGERIEPADIEAKSYYRGACQLAREYGVRGPVVTVTTACSASAGALGVAYDSLCEGAIDVALVGGADAFSPTTLAGFEGLKATAERFCAPFSKPLGLNLGEGGGFIVLERSESARKRGATILAQLLGYGISNDAYHVSAPDPAGRGQALAMTRALDHAGLAPGDIRYINAHGTGTAANDKAETKAVMRVFGPRGKPPLSSTKSMIGHCLGAAGIIELIASIMCARQEMYPPTAGMTEAREGCTLDYCPDPGRPWKSPHLFMANSFAFGGNNVSLIASVSAASVPRRAALSDHDPVVISSSGAVSPAGIGDQALDAADFVSAYPDERFFTVPQFRERDIDRRLNLRDMDNASRYAAAAAKLAIIAAGVKEKPATLDSLGVYCAHAAAPLWAERDHVVRLMSNKYRITHVHAFPSVVPNAIVGNVARALMLRGRNLAFAVAPQGGVQSIAAAAAALRCGQAEAILAGGVDVCDEQYREEKTALSHAASGGPWAEGAAFFMLERHSRAKQRNKTPLAEVAACSQGAWADDADSVLQAEALAASALSQAGIRIGDIDAVCMREADRVMHAALVRLGAPVDRRYDVESAIGCAETCSPLFSLAHALRQATLDKKRETNYILLSYRISPQSGIVLIFRRFC
jgi:3-oxoacyl-[acyl-carrier-protein] synthase II